MKRRETIVLAAGIAITIAAATAAGAANLGLLGGPTGSRPAPGQLDAGQRPAIEELVAVDPTATTLPPEIVVVFEDPATAPTATSVPDAADVPTAAVDAETASEPEAAPPATVPGTTRTTAEARRTTTTVDDHGGQSEGEKRFDERDKADDGKGDMNGETEHEADDD